MDASTNDVLRAYLDARLISSRYPDDPTPVAAAWAAQQALEYMLLERGWTEDELDRLFAQFEHDEMHALDATQWQERLTDALIQSTERSVRVAQALAHYHNQRRKMKAD